MGAARAAGRALVTLGAVDRLEVVTVVDNYIDALRRDESIVKRFSTAVARRRTDLRAEHGLAHLVTATAGATTTRIAFDFGHTDVALNHNVRELGLTPAALDAIALSHGHADHFGGLPGFLKTHRRFMRRDLTFYAGVDHFLPRFSGREGDLVYSGRLDRQEIERYGVRVDTVREPTPIADGVLLSGEMPSMEPFETIPATLRVERDGQVVPDTFIGEQTLIAHVRDRGLVVVTSCSHRGIVGICRNAVRVTGIDRIHAVVGGFHLSGLDDERVSRVVDAFRELGVEHIVPQHCTGIEAIATLYHRLPAQMVVSSVGSTFTFGAA